MGIIKLQGHEKFPLREGWLTKGIEILDVDEPSKIFSADYGPDAFGIGSNMVKALRYWLRAFGLIEEMPGKGVILTPFGNLIKSYDLYIENDFSLWLLHSHIVKNVDIATTWYMFFNKCDLVEFEKDDVFKVLKREIDIYSDYVKYSERSLSVDIDVLLSMYSRDKEMIDPEDKNISPFVKLELIKSTNKTYSKSSSKSKSMSEWVILYEILEKLKDRNDISIEELSHGINGLAKLYNLTDMEINYYLDRLHGDEKIRLDRTAGLDMIYKVIDISPEEMIEDYYRRNNR